MKIYTKSGDLGKSSLSDGKKIDKDELVFEVLGSLDELNAWIGLIRDHQEALVYFEELGSIQNTLFGMGAFLSTGIENDALPQPEMISSMEASIDHMTAVLPTLTQFILPGGHTLVSFCHLSRTCCRKTERQLVRYAKLTSLPPLFLTYLNRLSDYLFTLARMLSKELNAREILWVSKKIENFNK